MRIQAPRIARAALLTALGLLLAWLEQLMIPAIAVPGVKVGLANLASLLALYALSPLDALAVCVSRVLLSGFLFGSMTSLIYAMAGALLSLGGMCLLKRAPVLSVVGVSAAGGCLHNVAQLAVAAFMVPGSGILSYLPVLMIAGTLTGVVNGLLAHAVLERVGRQANGPYGHKT